MAKKDQPTYTPDTPVYILAFRPRDLQSKTWIATHEYKKGQHRIIGDEQAYEIAGSFLRLDRDCRPDASHFHINAPYVWLTWDQWQPMIGLTTTTELQRFMRDSDGLDFLNGMRGLQPWSFHGIRIRPNRAGAKAFLRDMLPMPRTPDELSATTRQLAKRFNTRSH